MYPQVPADSLALEKPRILVIQLGGELECAMTRGWIDALRQTADIDIVFRSEYSSILDILPEPERCHRLAGGPLEAMRIRRLLRHRRFDRALCLSDTLASRFLSRVCPPARRIRRQIGPPARPAEIDTVLAVLFGKLGVNAPNRNEAFVLTRRTGQTADALLRDFGFDSRTPPPVVAPRADAVTPLLLNSRAAKALIGPDLPVVLLPAGEQIELIGALVGEAFLVPAPKLPLRAALIQRARMLFSDHRASIELAALTRTPVFEPPGNGD